MTKELILIILIGYIFPILFIYRYYRDYNDRQALIIFSFVPVIALIPLIDTIYFLAKNYSTEYQMLKSDLNLLIEFSPVLALSGLYFLM